MIGEGGVWVGGLFQHGSKKDDGTIFTESKTSGLGRYGVIGALAADKCFVTEPSLTPPPIEKGQVHNERRQEIPAVIHG
jgi:hypothetical protein